MKQIEILAHSNFEIFFLKGMLNKGIPTYVLTFILQQA